MTIEIPKSSHKGLQDMDMQLLAETAAKAQPGTQFRLVFRREGITELAYLQGMLNGGILTIRPDYPLDQAVIMAVVSSKIWGHDANRTVYVIATETFAEHAEAWFAGRLHRGLESCEIVEEE